MLDMKTLVAIIIITAALVGGYFVFMKNPANTAPETSYPANDSSAGKLDINVVCESALSYMTFPDGESAAKFVAECKEGKHPEVIERYKADMNLGDGAAI
jgi:hypothetical protein